jgi:hypothetical protein
MKQLIVDVAEQKRLNDAREAQIPWKNGACTSNVVGNGARGLQYGRQRLGLLHEQSCSRAYRWGEDGLGGSPTTNSVCLLSPSGTSGIPSSERLFGLTKNK